MSDLVASLRAYANNGYMIEDCIVDEAADEIERLREENADLLNWRGAVTTQLCPSYVADISKGRAVEIISKLKKVLRDLDIHERQCHDCKNIAWYKDRAAPYVNCISCGSMDTREVRRRGE